MIVTAFQLGYSMGQSRGMDFMLQQAPPGSETYWSMAEIRRTVDNEIRRTQEVQASTLQYDFPIIFTAVSDPKGPKLRCVNRQRHRQSQSPKRKGDEAAGTPVPKKATPKVTIFSTASYHEPRPDHEPRSRVREVPSPSVSIPPLPCLRLCKCSSPINPQRPR